MEKLMPLQKYVKQLRLRDETYVPHVDKIQKYLRELTISPFYQQKGTFNPFYVLDDDLVSTIVDKLSEKEYDELLFKSVESGSGELIHSDKGKFEFQLVIKRGNSEIELPQYIRIIQKLVKQNENLQKRMEDMEKIVNKDINKYFFKFIDFFLKSILFFITYFHMLQYQAY